MKRFFTIAVVLLFVFLSVFVVKSTQTKIVSTTASTSGYAKILTNDCYLLASPNESSHLFLLEQSQFEDTAITVLPAR